MNDRIRRLVEQLQAELGQEQKPDPLLSELCAQFIESPEFKGLADPKTEGGRVRHIVRILGHLRVSQLRLTSVDDYRNTRATEPGRRKGVNVSPGTRNREVVRLVRILNWSVERKLIDENPLAGMVLEPENNTRRTSIEADDIDAMEEAIQGYKPHDPRIGLVLWAMVTTKYDSGLRREELVYLRWSQLSVKDGEISLQKLDTKGKAARLTTLSRRAADAIVACPRDIRFADSPFVFLSGHGAPYHPRTFLRMFQELAALAGVKAAAGERVWAHDLRAGFVGQQLELKIPEREIMDMTGHKSHDVFDRYVRRKRGAVSRAKELLDQMHAERRGPQRSERSQASDDVTTRTKV